MTLIVVILHSIVKNIFKLFNLYNLKRKIYFYSLYNSLILQTGLVTEKKDNIHYSEKFNHLLFAPSVRQFGGRAAEGVLVVSTTGMVGAIMITKDLQNSICYSTESLGNTRHRITAVDLCYGKSIFHHMYRIIYKYKQIFAKIFFVNFRRPLSRRS